MLIAACWSVLLLVCTHGARQGCQVFVLTAASSALGTPTSPTNKAVRNPFLTEYSRPNALNTYIANVWGLCVCPVRVLGLQVASPLLFGIPVANVAKAMLADAEAFRRGEAHGGSTATFSDAALRKSAASGQPPE